MFEVDRDICTPLFPFPTSAALIAERLWMGANRGRGEECNRRAEVTSLYVSGNMNIHWGLAFWITFPLPPFHSLNLFLCSFPVPSLLRYVPASNAIICSLQWVDLALSNSLGTIVVECHYRNSFCFILESDPFFCIARLSFLSFNRSYCLVRRVGVS